MTNLTYLNQKGINGVAFDPVDISRELIAYGEPSAAERILGMDDDTHARISEVAMNIMIQEGLTTDKAICLAAVEICEGAARPLTRKRRVYPKTS